LAKSSSSQAWSNFGAGDFDLLRIYMNFLSDARSNEPACHRGDTAFVVAEKMPTEGLRGTTGNRRVPPIATVVRTGLTVVVASVSLAV
jgi:hypothetical protein